MHTREGGERKGQGWSSSIFCFPKFAHVGLSRASEVHHKKPLHLTHSRFPIPPIIRLPDEAVVLHFILRDTTTTHTTTHNHSNTQQHTQTHTHQHILTNPPTHRPTQHHSPSLPPLLLSLPHANAHVHARVFVYVCAYAYVDV